MSLVGAGASTPSAVGTSATERHVNGKGLAAVDETLRLNCLACDDHGGQVTPKEAQS